MNIHSTSVVYPNVALGDRAEIAEFVLLGIRPQGDVKPLKIGDRCHIRSHSVIYLGNTIGDNFQTGHSVMIRENNHMGNNVRVGTHSIIERDNVIGDRVSIHSACFIPEFIEIQEGAWIGPGVRILNVLHPPCPSFEKCAKGTVIGKSAKIGGNVTLGPRIHIGERALIGAGSVVTKDIPPDHLAFGNPAKVVKRIDEMDCVLGDFEHPYEWEI